jgi:hypothetical protein
MWIEGGACTNLTFRAQGRHGTTQPLLGKSRDMSNFSELARAAFGIPIASGLTAVGLVAISDWRGLAVREVHRFCDQKGYPRMRNPMILARVAGVAFLAIGVPVLIAAAWSFL